MEVQRPPTLPTAGIQRIAIMPFKGSGDAATIATTTATARIQAMNHFTLVSPQVIQEMQRNRQSIESHVDALFQGEVIRAVSGRDSRQGSYQTREGQTVNYTDYITMVEVELKYELVMARDGRLVGPVVKTAQRSAVSREGYPAPGPLIRAAIEGALAHVGRDLAPHTVIENRTFAKDNSKNSAIDAAMKSALAQVRAGNHKLALDAYLDIYAQHKSAAAAINASILQEAFGEVQAAADLMKEVVDATGNPGAREVLARLNKILQDQATLAGEYSTDTPRSPADRVSAFASEEIKKILPKNANVWFYNNASANTMVEAVADNITADFIRNGIGVVDRQNAALIEEEQKLQMSGTVSDDDITRIGNAAGANVIVIIGITGTGAMRRLQVRVLDIERGVPILQSDTGENWQI